MPAPSRSSTRGVRRLPAYSGATVPDLHRVPVAGSRTDRRSSGGAGDPLPHLQAVTRAFALIFAALLLGAQPTPHPLRIVSLVPSITEDLFTLGVGDEVVGTSEFTNYPPAARRLPHVASSSSVDAERIVALHPDLVVGIPSQAAAVAPLLRAHLHVELLRDDSIADIYSTLTRLGALVERREQAAALEARMRRETTRLERSVPRGRRPNVFVVLDVKPIYTAGKRSYLTTLIEMAGGRNVASLDAAYGRYSAEALLEEQPDIIVVDPLVGFASVAGEEPWRSLRAVRNGNVALIPDPDALLQPSPRYNEGLRWLIRALHRSTAEIRHSDNAQTHG